MITITNSTRFKPALSKHRERGKVVQGTGHRETKDNRTGQQLEAQAAMMALPERLPIRRLAPDEPLLEARAVFMSEGLGPNDRPPMALVKDQWNSRLREAWNNSRSW